MTLRKVSTNYTQTGEKFQKEIFPEDTNWRDHIRNGLEALEQHDHSSGRGKSVAPISLTAGTQGDIIYAGASGVWAKLAAATSTYALKTAGAGANPAWGQVALSELSGIKLIRKSADETVTSSNTLQDDDHLVLAVAANEVWGWTILLRWLSHVLADISFAWSVPSGATMFWTNVTSVAGTTAELTESSTDNIAAGGTGTNYISIYHGVIVVSSTPGNMQFRWAQQTSYGYNTKVLANSYLLAHKEA